MRVSAMVCLSVFTGTGLTGCMNSALLPASDTVISPRAQRPAASEIAAAPPGEIAGPRAQVAGTAPVQGLISPGSDNTSNPWKPAVNERKWKFLVLHHTASDRGSVRSIHEAHRRRKDSAGKPWLGIGYHFVIGNGNGMQDGEIQPTFRWTKQLHGAHAGVSDYNQLGIGIVLVGNFEEHRPTPAQLQSARRLVKALRTAYSIDAGNIVTHGAIRKTACPGRFFSLARITELTREITVGTTDSTDAIPLTFAELRDVQ